MNHQAEGFLAAAADALDQFEATRLALASRLWALENVAHGDNPKARGESIEVRWCRELVAEAEHAEYKAERMLTAALRLHPLHPWIKSTVGLGEKSMARLLAALGPLTARQSHTQLWAYSGLHVLHRVDHQSDVEHHEGAVDAVDTLDPSDHADPDCQYENVGGVAPRRRKGERLNWNPEARQRAWVVADKAIRQDGKPDKNGKARPLSPYRTVYDQARAKYDVEPHTGPCSGADKVIQTATGSVTRHIYCKNDAGEVAGKGDPRSPSHAHACALRIVMKSILEDMWREARRHDRHG